MPKHRGFFPALFDFSFTDLITTKIIKVLYAIAIIAAGYGTLRLAFLAMIVANYGDHDEYALLAIVLAPLVFLLAVIVARVYLECFIVLFRIAEHASDISALLKAPAPDHTDGDVAG